MITIKSSLKFLTVKKKSCLKPIFAVYPKVTRLPQPLVGITAHEHFIFFFRNDFYKPVIMF